MAKLSAEVIEELQRLAESVDFGNITIQLNKTAATVDIIVEQRHRVSNGPLRPGMVVVKTQRQG